MKVLVAAGGTGGHIYPGVAIAKYIMMKNPDSQILFAGTNKGLEKDLIPKEGFAIKLIRVRGFKRKLSLDTVKTVKEMFLGLKDARKIVKEFKPDIVIGTGGYVCGPVLLAACQRKIPTIIHEQNAFPGITNRILSGFVDRVAVSFEEAKDYLKDHNKIFLSGNPIRSDFRESNRPKARQKLNIPLNSTTIIATGGSQGALSINQSMVELIKRYKDHSKVHIVHITGKNQYQNVMDLIEEEGIDISLYKNIQIVPYSFDMPNLFKASDLIIARAGAMTVSEICAVGRASILIPYPHATGNHQEFNARVITDKGGGALILDKDLNGETLYKTVSEIVKDKEKLKAMEKVSSNLGILNGDEIIYNEIEKLLN